MRRLIIGMTGSTGAIFGVRMLEALKGSEVESHLIISKWAQRTLEHETRYTVEQVRGLATVVHSPGDMGASISSGSFKTDGMAVMGLLFSLMEPIFMTIIMNDPKYDDHHVNVNGADGEF